MIISDGVSYWDHTGGNLEKAKSIAPGVYGVTIPMMGPPMIVKQDTIVNNEEYVFEPGDSYHLVKDQIDKFVNMDKWYADRGIAHKRGFLLYGPQGSGKSAIARAITEHWINDIKGIVLDESIFNNETDEVEDLLNSVLIPLAPVKVLVMIEEIDRWLRDGAGLASFIDCGWVKPGITVAFMGTTNHFDQIHPRFSARPGRFDERINIDKMSPAFIKKLCSKLLLEEKVVNEVLNKCNILNPAMVTEIAIRLELGCGTIKEVVDDIVHEFVDQSESAVNAKKMPKMPIKKHAASMTTTAKMPVPLDEPVAAVGGAFPYIDED